ncbi:MAG: co-chaperone GroES family protein [Planctomycetota bacterium]
MSEGVPEHMIVIGDRVLIRPEDETRTSTGLYLPQGSGESADVRAGRVISRGPGVPLPSPEPDDDEPWKESRRDPRFLPMQVEVGDFALFYKKAAIEVRYQGETFLVVPQSAVLVVVREPPTP